MAKVLVTGPTGPSGQYILERLMTTGHDVRVLAFPDSMHRINFRDRIEMVPGHVLDGQALNEALEGVEIVFHTALIGSKPGRAPDYQMDVNARGTAALAAAAAGKIARFVLVSSGSVYTPHRSPAVWPLRDDALRAPHGAPAQWALAESLIAAEDAVFEAAERGAFEHATLRPTTISGRSPGVIDKMLVGLFRGTVDIEAEHRIHDVMQWVHGTDLARAALLVAEAPEAANQCFLVAGETPVTIYDIQSLIWDLLNIGSADDNPYSESAALHNMGLPRFDPHRLASLGWRPEVGMRQCLMEVLGRLEFHSSASLRMPKFMVEA